MKDSQPNSKKPEHPAWAGRYVHVKREDRPGLPEDALREAVVNALAHRDYRSTTNVQVYIFKNRGPGGLLAGMTVADLGVKSIPRNPLLFGMLYRMEAVEQDRLRNKADS